jgi:hypothetical protein
MRGRGYEREREKLKYFFTSLSAPVFLKKIF